MSDEEPIASMKPKRKKKTIAKTKSATINNLPPNKSIVDTSTASTNNQSASKTSTAATTNVTVPGDVANVNLPKQRKVKKNALKTTFPTSRIQSARKIWMKVLMIIISLILRQWRIMSRLMYATGHKRLSVTFLN
jgi:hypothetical protein